MLGAFLKKLFAETNLSESEAKQAMDILMKGQASLEEIAGFLGVLRGKGETIDEIVGFARSMTDHSLTLPIKRDDLIDTCGTGGDGSQTFNISTVNSFVIAAAGLGVVKHGNRSVSSQCGSADVLEQLGVPIAQSAEDCAKSIDEVGFSFLFAPLFHPAMKNVGPVRKALGVRTVFNLLGPLCNPARVKRQIIGVYDRAWLEKLAYVLRELGSKEVMLVAGADGLDEITVCAETFVSHLKDNEVKNYTISPEDIGIPRATNADLQGGDRYVNASIVEKILTGELKGPKRDIVVFNAAAAFLVSGLAGSLKEGKNIAEEMLDTKKAAEVLEKVRNQL